MSLSTVLAKDSDETVGKMKVSSVLESMPGVGKVRARKIMEEIGISESRRVRGLGAQQMAALEPEISVVVAYGNLLPREVIDLPPNGTINIHASLLPKYRGAAPIQWAILDGDPETVSAARQRFRPREASDAESRQS